MIGNKILLDTNIITALLKGENGIADRIDDADIAYIPVIAVGELHYGAMYSQNIQKNIEAIEGLIASYDVLRTDEITAKEYGVIKADLRRQGKPIPENDIWIAAIAQQFDLKLITRDAHFNSIASIGKEKW